MTAKPANRQDIEASLKRARALVEHRARHVLVLDADAAQRQKTVEHIAGDDVSVRAAGTKGDAIELLAAGVFDCIVANCVSPRALADTLGLLEHMHAAPGSAPPVVLYVEESGGRTDEALARVGQGLVVRHASSPAEIIDEVAMFLHRPVLNLSEERRQAIQRLRQKEPGLQNHKVLIIDDDIRNIFSLTSVLEQHKVDVVYAENGRDGIAILKSVPGIDLALVDIMMPDMDGYETMREIRGNPRFRELPLIAVTAKAMKGDRQKCIDAGASDYVAKPVDIDLLLSLMRVWLDRGRGRTAPPAATREPLHADV